MAYTINWKRSRKKRIPVESTASEYFSSEKRNDQIQSESTESGEIVDCSFSLAIEIYFCFFFVLCSYQFVLFLASWYLILKSNSICIIIDIYGTAFESISLSRPPVQCLNVYCMLFYCAKYKASYFHFSRCCSFWFRSKHRQHQPLSSVQHWHYSFTERERTRHIDPWIFTVCLS